MDTQVTLISVKEGLEVGNTMNGSTALEFEASAIRLTLCVSECFLANFEDPAPNAPELSNQRKPTPEEACRQLPDTLRHY
jgi:hypothetical protein